MHWPNAGWPARPDKAPVFKRHAHVLSRSQVPFGECCHAALKVCPRQCHGLSSEALCTLRNRVAGLRQPSHVALPCRLERQCRIPRLQSGIDVIGLKRLEVDVDICRRCEYMSAQRIFNALQTLARRLRDACEKLRVFRAIAPLLNVSIRQRKSAARGSSCTAPPVTALFRAVVAAAGAVLQCGRL